MNGSECAAPADHLSPRPRLCVLRKWVDFRGYGFNLHAERGKAGQFIGKVDEDSPALYAGLKLNDKIVEVNGVNVLNQNHHQVVNMIRDSGDLVELCVTDKECEDYYRNQNLAVSSKASNVIRGETPDSRPVTKSEAALINNGDIEVHPQTTGEVSDEVDNKQPRELDSVNDEQTPELEPEPAVTEVEQPEEEVIVAPEVNEVCKSPPSPPPSPPNEVAPSDDDVIAKDAVQEQQSAPPAQEQPATPSVQIQPATPPAQEKPHEQPASPPAPTPSPEPQTNSELSFRMSAKEYREMMKKQRDDAKTKALGFKAKKDAFEQL